MSLLVSKIEREASGIEGIDNMTQGGFPKGSIMGISGAPGVGKSIFSLHFVLEGARQGQKAIYINLEEPRRNVDNMIGEFEFGLEFLELEKKGLIVVKCLNYDKYEKVQEDLFEHIIGDLDIKRMVIDSFNCFFAATSDERKCSEVSIRKMVVDIFHKLRRDDLTILLTLEKEKKDSNYNIPYLVDGLLCLDFLDLGTVERRVFIPKMRWTDQCKESRNYSISNEGISILEDSWGE